jgi:outer membrane protein assembly factor BamB
MRLLSIVALAVVLVLPAAASAQVSARGLLSTDALHANGLERMWFTQLDVDRARGRVVGLHQFVSSKRFHTLFEFTYDNKRYVFSERDRNAFGETIGVDAAKLNAETELAAIKARLIQAGKPVDALPVIETRLVPEITIAATTDRGMLQVLDGETGKTRWSLTMGSPNHPTTEPAVSDDYVAACNGSMLYVYRAADGQLAWQKQVVGAVGAGPALTDELIYVPMINGVMETYSVANPRRPRVFRAFGRTVVQPVASSQSVAWPTDQGKLYVGFARGGTMKYRVEAKDAMVAAPTFMPPDRLIATSMDGYVYSIEEGRGQIVWRFTTGESISQTPLGIGDNIYAITDSGELYAISATTGTELWLTTGLRSILAGNKDRVYATDTTGNVVVLDAKSGSRLGSLGATGLNLRFTNVQTDRIIIGTSTGLVQCIRERGLVWPVAHQQFAGSEPDPATQAKPGPAPAAEKPATDPFAEPGNADPFGGDAAPAEKPMPPAADPFGGDAADPFSADGDGEMKKEAPATPAEDPFG